MRILWINPIGTHEFDQQIIAHLSDYKRSDTLLDIVSFENSLPKNLEYHSYEVLVGPFILRAIRKASVEHYDAAIVGCFYDVILHAAREISGKMMVIGPCQASVVTAANLGNSFSVLVGRRKWIPKMKRNILEYGYGGFLTSLREVNLSVDDFDNNYELTYSKLLEQSRLAIEQDKAEVIILGCTAADKYYRDLQKELPVPLLDSEVTALKFAEFCADLAISCGVLPSRLFGSEPPPFLDLDNFLKA